MTSDSEQPPGETPALSMPNGTRLSDTYEIEAHIALGGMAEVYRAHNVHTGEPVAIKLVLPEFARDETILALFKKEATVLSRLRHDAIVHYHLFTIEKEMNRPYLVMDYVDGLALSDKLRQGPIAPQAVREMLLRVAAGLELAHGFGVVHRDLSPDNIILPNGEMRQARIIDFGIAKAATIGDGTLLGGKFAGKYNFVSPEQLGLFGGEVTEQSDIYSLGLVGAAALRGAALDMSGSHAEVLEKRRRVPDLGDIDPSLREVLEAMLEPDPAERLATMGEVIARLQRPPPSSAKTVIRPQGAGDMWTGGARGTRNEPARSPTTTAPVRTVPPQAEAARPIFDPLAPGSGVGESPFGAYVASDDAAGTARTRPPPPNPNPPRRSTTGPLLVTVAVLAAGGAALGWGYTQGWLDQLLGRTPPIAEPVPTPEPQPTPEPEPDAVPTPEPAPEPEPGPAPSAPGPTDEPTQDPLALNTLRMAWVSNYPMATCQYVSMVSPAEETVSVEGYATTVGAFEPLDAEFAAINGKAPDIVLRPITEEQCAVADFLRAVDPLTVPGPELALSSRTARDGVPLAIDITGTSGWDTRLFLIDDEGAIYDISRMLPEGSDGAFDLELNLSGTTEAVPGVLMTVATEPGRELPAIGDDDALTFLPRLALEMAKMPEQVAVNAQYLQLSP